MRVNLLKNLYDYHFANNGNMFSLGVLKSEEVLAYKYLEGKGFITYDSYYNQGSIGITSQGIDYIEQLDNN